MDGESILGCIIMALCAFGCALAFTCIGILAKKRKDPMHFYSGTTVDPKTISDIPAYNADNAAMWCWYALPYWISGACAIFAFFDQRFMYGSIGFLLSGCIPGIPILVWYYHRIMKRYQSG